MADLLLMVQKGMSINGLGVKIEKCLIPKFIGILKFLEQEKCGYFGEKIVDNTKTNEFDKNSLKMIWLKLTSKCNYKCIHCYDEGGCNSTEELNLQEYKNIIDTFSSNFKIDTIQLTGGEPLLRGKKVITELVDYISKKNINIEIFSNLFFLDLDYIKIFKKYKINVATSFYSQYENIFDEITKTKGSFKSVCNKIKLLKDHNIPIRTGIIIMNQNSNEHTTLRNWINNEFGLTENKYPDIVRPVGRGETKGVVPKKLFESKHHITKEKLYQNIYKAKYNTIFHSCWGDKLSVESNGDMTACIMSKVIVGNAKSTLDIVNLKKSYSYRFFTKDKVDTCKHCEYRYICFECRAMCINVDNEQMTKPNFCTYNPYTGNWTVPKKCTLSLSH
ncbi:MAG: radical SAM protein [Fibromonadaceae bacterium]|nr:radical SAM protein [Fibromonadaceae bacterium]